MMGRYFSLQFVPLLRAISLSAASPFNRRQNGSANFEWEKITPSPDLKWTTCFNNFTCSRLEVPLDYDDPSAGKTAIAFMKQDALNKTSETQDILLNPGGPGGSGIQWLLDIASSFPEIVGHQHNLIGFDPRGVNNSGPDLKCFTGANNLSEEIMFYTEKMVVDSSSPQALAKHWALMGAYGDACTKGLSSSAKYANTVAVATDMLTFVKKRSKEVGKAENDAKLWYYGISYGTILGSTFANLFPDRVGRLILDGVADTSDYYAGTWESNLADIDAAVQSFFKYCYQAGPEKCKFYKPGEREIEERFRGLVKKIREEPIKTVELGYPAIVGYEDLEALVLESVYVPIVSFPQLAEILVEVEKGNGSGIAGKHGFDGNGPAQKILCMDAVGRFNLSTIQAWHKHVDTLNKASMWLADTWHTYALLCRQLVIVPPKSQQVVGEVSANKTDFPILFIGNTVDPVTPIRGARKMAERFSGSVLLTQDSVGHCSITSPSLCTRKQVQSYLAGKPPAANTTCKPDLFPFQGGDQMVARGLRGYMHRR